MLRSTFQLSFWRIVWEIWAFSASQFYGRKEVGAAFPWKLHRPTEFLTWNGQISKKESDFFDLMTRFLPHQKVHLLTVLISSLSSTLNISWSGSHPSSETATSHVISIENHRIWPLGSIQCALPSVFFETLIILCFFLIILITALRAYLCDHLNRYVSSIRQHHW